MYVYTDQCVAKVPIFHRHCMSHLQDYPYLIQRPMSLSEVSHKLDAQEYGSPKDFTDDLVLIVKNSEVYNTDIRSLVSYCTTYELYSYNLMSLAKVLNVLAVLKHVSCVYWQI